jgi:hypothetical protein
MDWVVAFGGSDCERIRAGVLAQPVNAVSTLAYVVAAVAVLLAGLRATGPRRRLLTAYAAALAAVGVASFAYHGPQPSWAGWAHDGSIALAVAVGLAVVATTPAILQLAGPAARAPVIIMAAAVLAYISGRTGARTCMPSGALQPHAAWHLLSATAAAMLAWTPRSDPGPGP